MTIDFSLRIRIFIVFQSMPPAVFSSREFSSRSVLSASKSKKSRSARGLPGPGFAINPKKIALRASRDAFSLLEFRLNFRASRDAVALLGFALNFRASRDAVTLLGFALILKTVAAITTRTLNPKSNAHALRTRCNPVQASTMTKHYLDSQCRSLGNLESS